MSALPTVHRLPLNRLFTALLFPTLAALLPLTAGAQVLVAEQTGSRVGSYDRGREGR